MGSKIKDDEKRVCSLLRETVSLLCKNGLEYSASLKIQGLIGVTLDDDRVFIVQMDESVSQAAPREGTPGGRSAGEAAGQGDECDTSEPRSRKRRRTGPTGGSSSIPSSSTGSSTGGGRVQEWDTITLDDEGNTEPDVSIIDDPARSKPSWHRPMVTMSTNATGTVTSRPPDVFTAAAHARMVAGNHSNPPITIQPQHPAPPPSPQQQHSHPPQVSMVTGPHPIGGPLPGPAPPPSGWPHPHPGHHGNPHSNPHMSPGNHGDGNPVGPGIPPPPPLMRLMHPRFPFPGGPMPIPTGAERKQRTVLTLAEKVRLIKESSTKSNTQLQRDYNISGSQVWQILNRKEGLLGMWEKSRGGGEAEAPGESRYSCASAEGQALEGKLADWYREESRARAVTGTMLQDKGLELASDLGLANFMASAAWLAGFKRRHDIPP